jgi:hypothetical protein
MLLLPNDFRKDGNRGHIGHGRSADAAIDQQVSGNAAVEVRVMADGLQLQAWHLMYAYRKLITTHHLSSSFPKSSAVKH